MGWKRQVIRFLHGTGGFSVSRSLYRGWFRGATVLLYHRVLPADAAADHYVRLLGDPDAAQLESLLRYLKRHFRFATPRECVARWSRGEDVDPHTLLLTFDDGYLDMHDLLLPVLRKCEVPATVFIATGAMGGYVTWFQRLFSAMNATRAETLPAFEGVTPLPLRSAKQRVSAIEAVSAQQRHHRAERWEEMINTLCQRLGWDGSVPTERMMNWSHVEALHRSGLVEIGGHTVTHPLLEQCTPEQARTELYDSCGEIRSRLGIEAPAFSYPQGRVPPVWVQQLVKDAGYNCAFTGRRAANTAATPLYQLGRQLVPPDDVPMASFLLSGLRRAAPVAPAERGVEVAAGAPVMMN